MKVLELFACAGGASRGIVAAGNEVIATDISEAYLKRNPVGIDSQEGKPQGGKGAAVRQPWEWVAENAASRTEVLDWEAALLTYGEEADWVWASPPCQTYSATKGLVTGEFESLVEPVREALVSWGKPYVIENVPGAPLKDPVSLCGCMFYGLRVYRERLFESNLALVQPPHYTHEQRVVPMGRPAELGKRVPCQGHNSNKALTRAAMGYEAGRDDPADDVLSESIPPHFAYYIAQEMRRLI